MEGWIEGWMDGVSLRVFLVSQMDGWISVSLR